MRTKSSLIFYPQFAQGWYRIVNSWTGYRNGDKIHYYNKSFTSICGVSGDVDRGLVTIPFINERKKCKLCLNHLEKYQDINNMIHG